jgi:hypothetical protein
MRVTPVVSRDLNVLHVESGETEMAWSYDCGLPLAPTGVEARIQLPGIRASTPGIA